MLKQSDAIVVFVILAATVGVLILSSNTASLAIVAVLATVFGGLLGTRLRRAKEDGPDKAAGATPATMPSSGSRDPASAKAAPAAARSAGDQRTETAAAVPVTKPPSRRKSASEEATAAQVTMLKKLVASVAEGITLKDPQGRYLFANTAFARMLGSRPSDIVGRDDTAILGHLTARMLLLSDDGATARGQSSMTLEVPLASGPRFFEITKTAINSDDDDLEGTVAVWRDVSEVARDRIRREKAMHETIVAFTKSIEIRDTYLGDHAQRLAHLSAAVADAMGLETDIRTTVELAGYLSQIGKFGIDANLLSQQRRFSEQEIKHMQKHVHNTARLLSDMDFGLPVADALYQMNERLDGTGYPHGLHARDIAMPARILAVCDVFCARTAARSYRPAIAAEAALDILRQNPHRYDEAVVGALHQVVTPTESERLTA